MTWGQRVPTKKNRQSQVPETCVGNSEKAVLLVLRKQVECDLVRKGGRGLISQHLEVTIGWGGCKHKQD